MLGRVRGFLSPETELFFVKAHIIHALAESTSDAYFVAPETSTHLMQGIKWKEVTTMSLKYNKHATPL